MFFQHVYDKGLAQASYVIGCQKAKVAAVIDPKRDVDTYLDIAKQNNISFTHETILYFAILVSYRKNLYCLHHL
jgi:hydroxyacylglutathione hydrolase